MNRKSSTGARYEGMSATCEREGLLQDTAGQSWARRAGIVRRSTRFVVLTLATVACIQSPVPPLGGTPAEQLGATRVALCRYARPVLPDLRHRRAWDRTQRPGRRPRRDAAGAPSAARTRLTESLHALDDEHLGGDDREAVRVMLRQLAASASIEAESAEAESADAVAPGTERCAYTPSALAAGDSGLARLSARLYQCYGDAARRVVTPTDTSDRLTVLGRLATEPTREGRRALFFRCSPSGGRSWVMAPPHRRTARRPPAPRSGDAKARPSMPRRAR